MGTVHLDLQRTALFLWTNGVVSVGVRRLCIIWNRNAFFRVSGFDLFRKLSSLRQMLHFDATL